MFAGRFAKTCKNYNMKNTLLILFFSLLTGLCIGQPPQQNSSVYDRDSLWKPDVMLVVDSFVHLRKALLAFQQENQASLLNLIDTNTLRLARELDEMYQTEVLEYKNWFTRKALSGKRKKQGYAYVDLMLKLDALFFYPDLYAVFVSSARLEAQPKIEMVKRDHAQSLYVLIMGHLNGIGFAKKDELLRLFEKFRKVGQAMPHTINQDFGLVSDEDRYGFHLVDMLLCLSRE
jgi:hypothetical protein